MLLLDIPMKTLSMFLAIAGVIILVLIGLAFYQSDSDEAQSPVTDTSEEATDESPINQFVQEAPTGSIPPNPEDGEEVVAESETPSADTKQGETVTIQVDETGFQPATVSIAAGTTVKFVNNGQAAHWPASDLHPTHNILPEFDADKGLETGETYEFTFTKVGTWSMHDHLFPNNTGTITVK